MIIVDTREQDELVKNYLNKNKIPYLEKKLIDTNVISSAIAKKVFIDMFETGKMAKQIVDEKGLVQITDTKAIEEIIVKVVDNNSQSVSDYLAGKDKAIGFLVGQIMKETKGKANPKIVNELLLKILEAKK